ncbi:MAG: hypothetical protein COX57_05325 [Alphaproteobacteria bacterium CG_4_10_14_0_2_um_filter_63_37]|nr:MAG: hypothetical protein AUJ55_02945 [Proteobacteria bacterium CG1_02_64_396]PJA25048.1 MAG: hypothetical protein COX57_05325 [Alphaproteobacteria bacterium CG_4_10_14_0_2_um_filter_63_37]
MSWTITRHAVQTILRCDLDTGPACSGWLYGAPGHIETASPQPLEGRQPLGTFAATPPSQAPGDRAIALAVAQAEKGRLDLAAFVAHDGAWQETMLELLETQHG